MSLYQENNAVRTASWVSDNLERFQTDEPDYRLVEVDMDPEAYNDWHIPGAVQIDWESDIVTGLGGSVIESDEFASLMGERGITPETTVVLYGDRANWFAGHAYWVLQYYCHNDVQLLDGGRRYWNIEGYETTTEVPEYSTREYTVSGSDDSVRAYKTDVLDAIDSESPIVDVRNPQEYRGEKPPAEIPNTTEREGHIPTADNISWGEAVNADGTFKSIPELRAIYEDQLSADDETIAYCRIGERSSITWFVLSELLGEDVKNYDGSWTEWAADKELPIETITPQQGGDD